uniref:Uncharacterized protein n=1 Tax=Cacopsylla melanoneura TaxID=428564 RepID=A0A8D8ZAE0_9HEMI
MINTSSAKMKTLSCFNYENTIFHNNFYKSNPPWLGWNNIQSALVGLESGSKLAGKVNLTHPKGPSAKNTNMRLIIQSITHYLTFFRVRIASRRYYTLERPGYVA